MVVQLQQGCCCSLKAATIAIGAFGIVFYGVCMIIATATKYDQQTITETNELINELIPGNEEEQEHGQVYSRIVKVIVYLFEITMSTVLVVGAVKARPKLVYPWIVLNVVQTSLSTILLLALTIYIAVIGSLEHGLSLFVALTINAVIQAYMILVVNSYHTTILSPPTYDYTMKKDPIMHA